VHEWVVVVHLRKYLNLNVHDDVLAQFGIQSFPSVRESSKVSVKAFPRIGSRSCVTRLLPFCLYAIRLAVRVAILPATAERKGILEAGMEWSLRRSISQEGATGNLTQTYPNAPSSKHFPHAIKVPTDPLNTSPCPPHLFKPPSMSTSIVSFAFSNFGSAFAK